MTTFLREELKFESINLKKLYNQLDGELDPVLEFYKEQEGELEESFKKIHSFDIFNVCDQEGEDDFENIHNFDLLNASEEYLRSGTGKYKPKLLMSNEEFQDALRALNPDQRGVFDYVTRWVSHQTKIYPWDPRLELFKYQDNELEQAFKKMQEFDILSESGKSTSQRNEPLRLFITGNAGTGKTFLLNVLKEQINRLYGKESVQVCALTGVAARHVGGSTLHYALKLPVRRRGKIFVRPSYDDDCIVAWQSAKFFFIDEISMVPYEMLSAINSRLKGLRNSPEPFGGLSVILFGDLMQLPPVAGHEVFDQPLKYRPEAHLWRLFSLFELKENMRQRGSDAFIDVLNALRVGELRNHHCAQLIQRVSGEATGVFSIERALRIYPTNRQANDHNQKVLNLYKARGVIVVKIKAQHKWITRNVSHFAIEDSLPSDIEQTTGLAHELELFVGAKVMLRANVDVSRGLTNGAIGYITDIRYGSDLPKVSVDFGKHGNHTIAPRSVEFVAKFKRGLGARKMVPLVLCWAATVHKMQGSTVDHAVVYLGSKIFSKGQAYVALSRVRSLEGLRISELDLSKIRGKVPCNNAALKEMDRLRKCRPNFKCM